MKHLFFVKITAMVVAMSVLGVACDDDLSTIGDEIIDVDPNNKFTTEEIDVIAYTERINEVQVSDLPGVLLGVNNDEVFGNRVYSVLSQASLATYDPDFGTNPEIFEIVVNIPYFSTADTGFDDNGESEVSYRLDSIYNANDKIKLSLYYSDYFLSDIEAEDLDQDKRYFSQDSFAEEIIQKQPIYIDSQGTFSASTTAVTVPSTDPCDPDNEETSAPAFEMKITDEEVLDFFKEKILDQEGALVLSNKNNFQEFFRGFYLKAAPITEGQDGILAYLDLSQATVTIWYTTDPNSEDEDCTERLIHTIPISFSDTQVNLIEGTFDQDIDEKIKAQDKTLGADALYLKGGEGSIAVLEIFPGDQNQRLAELAAQKIILNDATIKCYVDTTSLLGLPSDSQRIYIYDYESGAPLIDLLLDPLIFQSDPANAFSSSLGLLQSDDHGHFFELNLTQHINNLIYNSDENTNRKLGLCVTQNAGLPISQDINGNVGIDTGTILDFENSEGENKVVPAGSVIDPDGLIIHGNTITDLSKRLKLNLVYTKPID